VAVNRLADQHLLDERPRLGSPDLCAEGQHVPAITQHHRAVDGRQATNRIGRILECAVARAGANQLAQLGERRRDLIRHRDDRLAPGVRAVRHHEE